MNDKKDNSRLTKKQKTEKLDRLQKEFNEWVHMASVFNIEKIKIEKGKDWSYKNWTFEDFNIDEDVQLISFIFDIKTSLCQQLLFKHKSGVKFMIENTDSDKFELVFSKVLAVYKEKHQEEMDLILDGKTFNQYAEDIGQSFLKKCLA